MKKNIFNFFCVCCLIAQTSWSQSYKQQLADVFLSGGPASTETSDYSFTKTFSNSGSTWQIDWNETYVFDNLFQYTDPSNANQSYQMRMGKGGQIYSFKNAGFGEALPPQWRPSFNAAGTNIGEQPPSDPVVPNHGNWATWNDEVWQMVGSDQIDELEGVKTAQNIHQAGPYMNNYTHRASDLTDEPFYSPQVNSYYDASNQSYTSVYWGQSENPDYVYDPVNTQDPFRPSTLYYQRYKNLGDGVIQVDFLIFNYHRTRGIDYWNVPWAGIRNSSLPYAFVSNSATNQMTYESLNSLPGYVENSTDDLPEWSEGVTRKTSGNNSLSSGWFAFSNTLGGNGPSLAFVTAKSTSSPTNGYGDLRWGTAMGPNGIRDLTIFSRRSIGGPEDPNTGLKSWGIIGGESIRGRYFIVIDSSIDAIVAQIQSKNLVAAASIEKFTFTEENAQDLFYTFTNNGSGNFTANETTQENSDLTIKSKPFVSSFPVYILTTASATRITADPYYFSLRPYDGMVTSMELLGFSATALDINPATLSAENPKTHPPLKLYPNPVKKKIFLSREVEAAKIYNVSGRLIQQINTTQAIFDASNLSSGLYFMEVSVKNIKQTLKFVVQ